MTATERQTLICIPTFNECDNIAELIRRILDNVPACHILVIDDNSPDRTGDAVRKMALLDSRVRLLPRPDRSGIGRAYLAAFDLAIAENYEFLIQCDADFSHNPDFIPALLQALRAADLVIGSRRVKGGGSIHWSLRRNAISRAGNAWARHMLRSPLRDMTAGFNAIRVSRLPDIDYHSLGASGFVFQIELKQRMLSLGCRVVEIPIVFEGRRAGHSKMTAGILFEAISWVWRHRVRTRR